MIEIPQINEKLNNDPRWIHYVTWYVRNHPEATVESVHALADGYMAGTRDAEDS